MKSYRYAPLLAAMWFLVASFTKVLAYFDTPVESVDDNPTISSSVEDLTVDKLPAVEQKAVSSLATDAKYKSTAKSTVTNASRTRTACAGYYGYISVGGKNICLKSTSSTGGSLSYNYGYIFNSAAYQSYNSYIFAHNSAGLFGGLKNLAVGTGFSVTVNGETVNYQISKKVVYCDYSNPSHPCANYSDPVLNMLDAVKPARQGADIALMTCAGQGIGDGDATHRLTVYGRRV